MSTVFSFAPSTADGVRYFLPCNALSTKAVGLQSKPTCKDSGGRTLRLTAATALKLFFYISNNVNLYTAA